MPRIRCLADMLCNIAHAPAVCGGELLVGRGEAGLEGGRLIGMVAAEVVEEVSIAYGAHCRSAMPNIEGGVVSPVLRHVPEQGAARVPSFSVQWNPIRLEEGGECSRCHLGRCHPGGLVGVGVGVPTRDRGERDSPPIDEGLLGWSEVGSQGVSCLEVRDAAMLSWFICSDSCAVS